MNLFEQIVNNPIALSKFIIDGEQKACVYPNPYQGISDVVRWFYSRNNACQIFFACSKEISDRIDEESWADINWDFTIFVEHELMPYCVENTFWHDCHKHYADYDKKAFCRDSKGHFTGGFDMGCMGGICHCEPFGQGDFTYGIADENEFNLA